MANTTLCNQVCCTLWRVQKRHQSVSPLFFSCVRTSGGSDYTNWINKQKRRTKVSMLFLSSLYKGRRGHRHYWGNFQAFVFFFFLITPALIFVFVQCLLLNALPSKVRQLYFLQSHLKKKKIEADKHIFFKKLNYPFEQSDKSNKRLTFLNSIQSHNGTKTTT